MATEMGKFPHELDNLPVDEYDRLLTFFAWKHKQDKVGDENKEVNFLALIKERTNK